VAAAPANTAESTDGASPSIASADASCAWKLQVQSNVGPHRRNPDAAWGVRRMASRQAVAIGNSRRRSASSASARRPSADAFMEREGQEKFGVPPFRNVDVVHHL
jgi:hypothetical protein